MNSEVQKRINQAILEHKNGNLKKAEIIYNELLNVYSNNPNIYYFLGNLRITQSKLEEAAKNFQKAVDLNPDFFQAQINLANTFKELSKTQSAEQIYKKVIKLMPNYEKAYLNLGILQQDDNRLNEAEFNLKKAIKINPNSFQAYLNLGSVLKNLSKFEEAVAVYKKAINLKPNYAKAYNNLGTILVDLVKLDEAEMVIRKAIELDKNLSESFINLDLVQKQKKLLKIKGKQNSKNRNNNTIIDHFISKRKVEKGIVDELYKIKTVELDTTIKYDARYGNGKCSPDFNLFKNNVILKDIENDLISIIEKAVNSKIFIIDSFFNILREGGGTTPHKHINQFDKTSGLIKNKFSLTYYLSVGDQSSSEPGILKLYDPDYEILPENGTIVIIPASRSHSAIYNGKLDRVMIGINFYSI